jgi:hypothetical protein
MSEAAQALEIRKDRIGTPLSGFKTSGRIEGIAYIIGKELA